MALAIFILMIISDVSFALLPSTPYNEQIFVHGPRFATMKSEVNLNCTVSKTVPRNYSIDWYFKTNSLERLKITNQLRTQWSLVNDNTSLVIRNARSNEAGIYECCLNGFGKCAVNHLNVLDILGINIDFFPSSSVSGRIVVMSKRRFGIVIHHGDFDVSADVFKNDSFIDVSDPIVSGKGCPRSAGAYFKCFNVSSGYMEDSGWLYITSAFNNTACNYKLNIMILGRPELEMNDMVFLSTLEIDFICRGRAYPPPKTITCEFRPCNKSTLVVTDCSNETQKLPLNISKHDDSIHFVASGRISSPAFGKIICKASNDLSQRSTNATIFPLNFYGDVELEVTSPTRTITYGDTVVLRCRSNAFNFTNKFIFEINNTPNTMIGHKNEYSWEVFYTLKTNSAVTVKCRAEDKLGALQSSTLEMRIVGGSTHAAFSLDLFDLLAVVSSVAILIFLLLLYSIVHQKRKTITPEGEEDKNSNSGETPSAETPTTIVPDGYKIDKADLIFGRKIGEGEFGVVVMAEALNILPHEPSTTVAVKIIEHSGDEATRKSAISELKMFGLVGRHLNIVNFLGVVTDNLKADEVIIVLEYCRYGSLLEFMRNHKSKFLDCKDDLPEAWKGYSLDADLSERPNQGCITRFQTTDLIYWALQIASGMEYMASKNVCHGDLAARNILLCEKNVVKISDFGLARVFNRGTFYQKTSNDRVPYKWMALESIFQLVFSVKTDVWSYGVLLWELFSLGATPYPTYAVNEEFLNKLRDGYRMDRPEYASKEIYEVMRTCWYVNPDLRPSFESLAQTFNVMLPHVLQNHYLKINDLYLEVNL